jgi:hypothetical protein
MKSFFLLLCCLFMFALPPAQAVSDVIIIHDSTVSRAEKSALLILPGLGDGWLGRRHQRKVFAEAGYDLFIPDFHVRKSFDSTVQKLRGFYTAQHLDEYREVKVLSYILGSWVLNEMVKLDGRRNLTHIVYDRSPWQERAPRAVSERIPLIGRIAAGYLVIDLAGRPYPPIDTTGLKVGLLIESKATLMIKVLKKTAKSYGPIAWEPDSLHQDHHDFVYIPLDHHQMYHRLDQIEAELFYFWEHGRFSAEARRTPFGWDAFGRPPK